ncbi:MAG TPA: DUF429 domain-containing protein [Chloroflexota bacterium]
MARAANYPFIGIDLTAGKRPSDVAGLTQSGRAKFLTSTTNAEIVRSVHALGGQIVAVDSPMGFPVGLCCLEETCECAPLDGLTGRSAERELAQLGISCFWTTKRTIIKAMIYRAIELKAALEASGCIVLEVYPYAVKRLLLGKPLPKKSTELGLARVVAGAREHLPGFRQPAGWQPTHDQLDALFCAITAQLHAAGQTQSLGDPSEVPIIIPRVPEVGTRALPGGGGDVRGAAGLSR